MTLSTGNLHPLSKAAYMAMVIILVTWFQSPPVYLLAALLILLGLVFTRERRNFLKKALITSAFLFLPMFTLQLFFKPGENLIFSWFIFRMTKESLDFAVSLLIRLSLVASVILLYFHTTKPKELMVALEQRGISSKITYMFLATIMLVPQTIRQSKSIMEAQKVRGIEVEGRLITRFKAFIPMITPLILSSLLSIEERALTLEARGFFSTGQKTFLYEKKIAGVDKFIIGLSGLIPSFFIIKAVYLWLI